jgi:dTDP-4-dehydrorhamnose 3,5-epimerase-like enzyme
MHAIGYLVQSEYAEVFVASSVSYQSELEIGVNVSTLEEISILVEGCILSEKDLNLPSLQEVLIQLNSRRFE